MTQRSSRRRSKAGGSAPGKRSARLPGLRRCAAALVACAVVPAALVSGAARAGATSPSIGCQLAPLIGGLAGSPIPSASASDFPFNAGETLVVVFTNPTPGATVGTLTIGQGASTTGISSQSTPLPGSLSYTFPATGAYSLQASVDAGLAVMAFTCSAAASDTDLALSAAPPDITAPATGPAGAVVSYTAPAALDEDSSSPTVSCDHASGSTFPIGTTTVTCTATDADDTPSSVSASFNVNVLGASDQLDALGASVTGVGPGNSLPDTIGQAESDLAAGNIGAVCQGLDGFAREVAAQDGKSIPGDEAFGLIASARGIEAVLACPSGFGS
jgi:hypothetical protein